MESDKLYRVQREDLPKLEKMLCGCFANDPLYQTLIPDAQVRKNLMPELFHCDMDEFYETCEIFADSPEMNGLLVVSDEAEPYNIFKFYYTEAKSLLQTDGYLIKEEFKLDRAATPEESSSYYLSGSGTEDAASWNCF